MNQLIAITQDAQGASVVSARELHGFLEVKTEFVKWCRRMFAYGFVTGQDYAEVFAESDENPKGGRPQTDYVLSLDCAKELAMLQRSEQGKAARQYFIDCEKQLREVAQAQPTLTATEQLLLQVVQQNGSLLSQQQTILNQQQQMLEQLRADVRQIQAGGKPRRRAVDISHQFPLFDADGHVPADGQAAQLRHRIIEDVTRYSGRLGVNIADTYRYLYRRMLDVHQLNVWNLKRQPGQSYLDAIEQYGQLDRLHTLVIAELTYTE